MSKLGLVATIGVVMLLASCSSGPLAPMRWLGTDTRAGVQRAVELVYTLYGTQIFGTFYLDHDTDAPGEASGSLVDGGLDLLLTDAAGCTFDFDGTINVDTLQGSYVPIGSCQALPGTWHLEKQ